MCFPGSSTILLALVRFAACRFAYPPQGRLKALSAQAVASRLFCDLVGTFLRPRHLTQQMPTIVALAGRRIDSPNAETERFPAPNIERVRRDIYQELKKRRARWLVSSAAAGADLLAIKAATDLGIASRIILSPSVREFARMSVEDQGSYWTQEFNSAVSAIPPDNIFCIPAQLAMADTFRSINERILSDAVALSVSWSADLVCFAVWDGIRRGNDDFSADFVERAVTRGLPVTHISTV